MQELQAPMTGWPFVHTDKPVLRLLGESLVNIQNDILSLFSLPIHIHCTERKKHPKTPPTQNASMLRKCKIIALIS